MEDGMQKKVTENYVVDALSFSEAEERITEEMSSYVSGEFDVADIKIAPYAEVFFADNDIIAVSCIRAFREWGVRIPEDISVIGFDDVPLSCVTSPRLSTVRVEKETLGRLAITLLRDRMDNPAADAPVKLSVGTSLCLRDSVRIL